MIKPLLTLYQRRCLIEYLTALHNKRRQKKFYADIMEQWQALVESHLERNGGYHTLNENDLAFLQDRMDRLINNFIHQYYLHNHRDYMQVKVSLGQERNEILLKPGTVLVQFHQGTSEIDLCEYHKSTDRLLLDLAEPYVPHTDATPLSQDEIVEIEQYLTRRWQKKAQRRLFRELDTRLNDRLDDYQYNVLNANIRSRIEADIHNFFLAWFKPFAHHDLNQLDFNCGVKFDTGQPVVWYSQGLQSLSQGQHPSNFVHIDRSFWNAARIRATYHEERVKEARENV